MLEFLQYIEGIAPRLEPMVLIVPGLLCVLVGLFVWIGGLRYAKLIAAFLGTLAAGTCGILTIGRKLLPDIFLAVSSGFIAMFLYKLIFVLLAALIAVAGVTFFLADVDVGAHTKLVMYINSNGSETIGASEAAAMLGRAIGYLMKKTEAIYAQFSILRWSAVVAAGAVAAILTVYFGKVVCAICCATLGTVLNFTGMILLLFYKGAEPVSRISQKGLFFAAIFAGMIAFGTIVQLVFCLPRHRKDTQEPKTEQAEQQNTEKSQFVARMPWLS
jgi:hypothetical protein